jgi:hypothetical protein
VYIYSNEVNPVLARDREQRRGQTTYREVASVEVVGIPTGAMHGGTKGPLAGKSVHEWICRVVFVDGTMQTHTGPMRH